MEIKNKNGLIGFGFAVASIFFYEFLILQLIAIYFSYKGYNNSKINPLLSKWEYKAGFVIGSLYLVMFFVMRLTK